MSPIPTFLDQDQTVYIVEDVLSEEDYLIVKQFCDNPIGWFNYEDVIDTLFYVKPLRPKIFSIIQESILQNVINVLEPNLISPMTMPLLRHSSENTIHRDFDSWSIVPQSSVIVDNNSIQKVFTFFINDDYVGGESFLLTQNLTIKPKSNSLLVYSASDIYSSKEITDGYSYTFTEYLKGN